ncbi:hypothetical protein [Algoriphagus aquimarinus]|uniref:Lipocalin-like domain-containing protein n=1 Tax=Algoriphagus aquimarinus TaxID=237018 RepID=A0A1I1CDH0_9BACT|nr:hypothetical protein [Algoriphagus aquimarinus]SFB60467.1 hypothetical protein SAMN04489723_12922 [Algoriphagus aquimarinus]
MKTKLLYFLLLAFVVLSCSDEDKNPDKTLIGTWELVTKGSEFDGASTFEIIADGTIKGMNTIRKKDSRTVLGYQSVFSGTYSNEGSILIVKKNESAFLTNPDFDYVDKEDLTSIEGYLEDDRYNINDNFSKLYYSCPPNALCSPPKPYLKIK